MDDLPDLAFQQVLSYLNLEDLLKSRAISRAWKLRIDNYRVKSLCYSKRPSRFIEGKRRWVCGIFAQNLIGTTRFASFFNMFCHSILSNLKHLRLCDVILKRKQRTAFAEILQSFGRLEQLEMIFSGFSGHYGSSKEFKLRLPMLRTVQLKDLRGIGRLTLDAPRLQNFEIRQ